MTEKEQSTDLVVITENAPLIEITLRGETVAEQTEILHQALAVAGEHVDLITLSQHALITRLNLAHTPQNNGFACSIDNGKMGMPKEAWRHGARLSVSNGVGGRVNGHYSVYNLWAETEEEALALRTAYIERQEAREAESGKGIASNEWGGLDINNFELTTQHVYTRVMYYLFVLGDGEDGWSRYGDSLRNSELFHPLLVDLLPLNELIEQLLTIYKGVMAMPEESRSMVMEPLKTSTEKIIADFLAQHADTIKAAEIVINDPTTATRTLELIKK